MHARFISKIKRRPGVRASPTSRCTLLGLQIRSLGRRLLTVCTKETLCIIGRDDYIDLGLYQRPGMTT
uniref:Uncharacterized protein n=1 Tax=Arundo donax TaxID=35708 RepID=A0A0A9D6M7_ARUDO